MAKTMKKMKGRVEESLFSCRFTTMEGKMDIYTIECTDHRYDCSQPCLTFLINYTLVACYNYITIRVNVVPNQHLFATSLRLQHI